jgi:hypothetical protein
MTANFDQARVELDRLFAAAFEEKIGLDLHDISCAPVKAGEM